jgi:biofilm PGA synthesis N-glycosyltransferase PgaC
MQWLFLIIILPYLFLLLKIWKKLIGIAPFSRGNNSELYVSVIVACHNEEANLPFLLKDLSLQNYDSEMFEVIIIDDHSSDRTFKISSDFKSIKNLKVLRNSHKGKKHAIRTGIAASSGALIITTDGDCRAGENWIKTIVSFYALNKTDLIICPVKLENKSGFFHDFQQLEYLSLQGITAGTAAEGDPVMCNGANMAFLKETYNRHSNDLHDEIASGDDVFLLHSIKKEPGSKIMWLESQDAIVTTRSQESIKAFIKQRVRWISKAGAYKDTYTRVLAIVTFVTILLILSLLVTGVLNWTFLPVFSMAFILKSVPDYLILYNTAKRYNQKRLLRTFLPGQFLYPFYALAVFFCFLTGKKS